MSPADCVEGADYSVLLHFTRQVRREATAVFWSFPFLGMLALGLFVHIHDASSVGDLFGTSVYPRTYLMLESLQGMYSIVLLLVVVLYSGDPQKTKLVMGSISRYRPTRQVRSDRALGRYTWSPLRAARPR